MLLLVLPAALLKITLQEKGTGGKVVLGVTGSYLLKSESPLNRVWSQVQIQKQSWMDPACPNHPAKVLALSALLSYWLHWAGGWGGSDGCEQWYCETVVAFPAGLVPSILWLCLCPVCLSTWLQGVLHGMRREQGRTGVPSAAQRNHCWFWRGTLSLASLNALWTLGFVCLCPPSVAPQTSPALKKERI